MTESHMHAVEINIYTSNMQLKNLLKSDSTVQTHPSWCSVCHTYYANNYFPHAVCGKLVRQRKSLLLVQQQILSGVQATLHAQDSNAESLHKTAGMPMLAVCCDGELNQRYFDPWVLFSPPLLLRNLTMCISLFARAASAGA